MYKVINMVSGWTAWEGKNLAAASNMAMRWNARGLGHVFKVVRVK